MNAFEMAVEALEIIVDKRGFKAELFSGPNGYFEITGNDQQALFSLLLRQKRRASGLSLAQVAQRLGLKSRNSYARYEQGRAVPTATKLAELLRVIEPGHDFVLTPSRA